MLAQQLKAATGLDLQKDVIYWMGDCSLFVRGTSVSELDGALIIETKDEAASGRFISALGQPRARARPTIPATAWARCQHPAAARASRSRARIFPKPVHLFQAKGRVVLAYGDKAAADAIDPATTLGDSADFTAARDSLGDYDVSFFVLMQPIFDLVDSTGAGDGRGWLKAKPYLEPLNALVGGTPGDGDSLSSAVKLIVK